ncbi:hypothetical protein SAMN05444169_6553 [Bradyrhizobium erythrophlei]|uniref:Uncharacterized protein n=1 Tax=Bradyrhizobium erythrophlei TaxID=1437360 RepID=A0A1M5RGH1_9BRAD|nr:hypothetical protein SAMN05444169_6553 [Bradyrhizobium erythrophlei]
MSAARGLTVGILQKARAGSAVWTWRARAKGVDPENSPRGSRSAVEVKPLFQLDKVVILGGLSPPYYDYTIL